MKILYHRYFPLDKIFERFTQVNKYTLKTVGYSFLGKEIIALEFGTGDYHIGGWCGMHGNETTAIRALDSIFNSSIHEKRLIELKETITFSCILCLNPDGAEEYTRVNAQGIDINRDFHLKESPEMLVLQNFIKNHNPRFDLLLNLHDQRSIFHRGSFPASLSVLAPSYNQEREINETRMRAMERICAALELLPNSFHPYITRFTDAFYSNATGDNFTALGYPTILLESGHDEISYERKLSTIILSDMLISLFTSVNTSIFNTKPIYNQINQNEENASDLLITNVNIYDDVTIYNCELSLIYQEVLLSKADRTVKLVSVLHKKSQLNEQLGSVFWNKITADEAGLPTFSMEEYENLHAGSPFPFL